MKAKNVVLVLAATGLISSQAYAADAGIKGSTIDQNLPAFTEADASSMFEQSGKPMQVVSLSSKEMKDTQGAAVPVALYHAAGGIAGMYGGGYGYLAGGGRSPEGFLTAVMGGAATGAFSPVRGFATAAAALGSGFTGGVIGAVRE